VRGILAKRRDYPRRRGRDPAERCLTFLTPAPGRQIIKTVKKEKKEREKKKPLGPRREGCGGEERRRKKSKQTTPTRKTETKTRPATTETYKKGVVIQ